MRGCVCGGTLVAIISLMVNNLGNTVLNNYYFLASVFKNGGSMAKSVKFLISLKLYISG